jgi:hypothetical protein
MLYVCIQTNSHTHIHSPRRAQAADKENAIQQKRQQLDDLKQALVKLTEDMANRGHPSASALRILIRENGPVPMQVDLLAVCTCDTHVERSISAETHHST